MRSNSSTKRLTRKIDHISLAKELNNREFSSGFADIKLIHQAISSLDLDDINISSTLFGKELAAPFLINAMTGGPRIATNINASLARAARKLDIGLAVGSQKLAISDKGFRESFTIVRKENPTGLIFANISALARPKEVLEAAEMIEADAIQLHLNLAQELGMAEGERFFRHMQENISEIVNSSPVPIIAKEVGFGISRETARILWDLGVTYLDIGGQGGTNFATIERMRQGRPMPSAFEAWGIPTAISIAEVRSSGYPFFLIATGGIKNALDIVKALAMGANLAGIAGAGLKVLLNESESALISYFKNIIHEFRSLMLLTGTEKLEDLKNLPMIITGKTRDWLTQRKNLDYYIKDL